MTEYHYVYSVTYTDVKNIYYGVRTSKCKPEDDNKYWGTPVTFKSFMDAHKATRVKTILATYPTREEAELAEDELIEKQWENNKSLSLNACINGTKFNMLGKSSRKGQSPSEETRKKIANTLRGQKRDFSLEHRKNLSKALKGKPKSLKYRQNLSEKKKGIANERCAKECVGVSPTGNVVVFSNINQFCRDNIKLGFSPSCISACTIGKNKTHNGWQFFSLEEFYKLKGEIPSISDHKIRSYAAISPKGVHHVFANASQFIIDNSEYKFLSSAISECAQGKINSHKGWKFLYLEDYLELSDIPPIQKKRAITGISPNGEHYTFDNYMKFAREHEEYGLMAQSISACAKGRLKTHKGWKFSYADGSDIA